MTRGTFSSMTTWPSRVLLVLLIPTQHLASSLIARTLISVYSPFFWLAVMGVTVVACLLIDGFCVENEMFVAKRLGIYFLVLSATIGVLLVWLR
jgi:hypothetical protein